jgi:RNA polymerase sigma-70 factor (ECF subfamily)
VDRALLRNYLAAWESGDLQAVIALLHAEATFSMPPAPVWFAGRAAIERFLSNRFCKSLRAGQFRGLPIEANAQAGLAFYRVQEDGIAQLFAIHLATARQSRIDTIEHFMTKTALASFTAEGLPVTLR